MAQVCLILILPPGKLGWVPHRPKQATYIKGASGLTPFLNSVVTIENATNNYLSLLKPPGAESGILFGSKSNADTGIIFNNIAAPRCLHFRTGGTSSIGNIARMVLTANGNLALGKTLDSGDYKLRIE